MITRFPETPVYTIKLLMVDGLAIWFEFKVIRMFSLWRTLHLWFIRWHRVHWF